MSKPSTLMSSTSTADFVAGVRALHQRQVIRIIDDPHAKSLCGGTLRMIMRFRLAEWFLVERILGPLKPVSMCVLMRARYAEQALEAAMADGVTQYVIVGAGMDSFAFRRADLLDRLDVFELDQSFMQCTKIERVEKAGLDIPPQLHFIPANLEEVSVADALAGCDAFDRSRPTFLSLLGLTYYLTPEALSSTLATIAGSMPSGSRVVFDYLLDDASCSPEHLDVKERLKAFVAGRGEPMLGIYAPAAMVDMATTTGFSEVENIPLPELARRYREELGPTPFEVDVPTFFAMGLFAR